MEYAEIKTLWEKYDGKLDRLEKLNRKMISESLSRKPKWKLFFLKYKSIQSIIVYPIALLVFLAPTYKMEYVDWKFILGWTLILAVLIYLIYINLKTYSALKAINPGKDTVVESAQKSNRMKSIYSSRYKNARISMPLLYTGIVLEVWNSLQVDVTTILIIVGLFLVLFLYNIKGPKVHRNMIQKLERDILEVNEYLK